MAQDAELKLKVSLDLAFFRQQLIGLGQASAGYKLPVQVQFDRRSVQNELNALGANIRRRNYILEVKTNLKQEIKNAKDLAAELAKLSTGAGGTIPRRSGTFRQELSNINLGQIQQIYAAAAKAGLVAFSEEISKEKGKIVTALNQAANDASQGFLNAFSSQNSAVRKAAGDYGNALLGGLRKTLRSQSPSQEMFDIGEDAGKGFELGLLKSMELAEQSATRKMRRMLDRLARVALMASGMSAAEINRQAGQFQGGASIAAPSWASTVPPSRSGGGGGRLLPPGPTFAALGGTAFGAQKYLPTDLSAELKQILRGAAFAFVDAIRMETRSVRVGIGASMQAALPASRVAGLLPAGVGRMPSRYATGAIGGETREQMFARRTQEAYTRSGLRGIDIIGGGAGREPSPYSYAYKPISRAIVPYQGAGALVATGGGGGAQPPQGPFGGGGFGGFGQFGRAMGGISLPGTGTIRELGAEFAFATKQVLLFGTAYKALAFIQAFPGEVGQAVGQLQSFRNTLGAISPTAKEAAASNQLILDLVDRYNIPLQSARDGFTKLYASMAPAGFNGDEIRSLFTGISQAAATFGMSADKVDRVNYAFAQMASKGQVMSEELKGQLGDVLPGAMAIFAEAAGFKGPKAIQDFSAALEDGQYKGQAMVALLKNVGVVMTQEFGPGAEGAARTFQGSINRMQNSLKLLYESFEPVAVGFLNSVVTPLTQGIKQVADGVSAFFSGTQAKTAGGFVLAQELERLRPAFDGIKDNVSGVVQQLGSFAKAGLEVSKVLLQIAGNPIVGYLGKLYLIALPLNILFNGLTGIIGRVVIAMTTLNVGLLAGAQRFATYKLAMQAFGVSAAQVSTVLRTWAPALNFATIALRAIAAPAVLFGISLLIERFMMLQGAISGVAQSTQSMLGNISSLANSGAVKDLKNVGKDIQNQIGTFESLKPFVGGGALGPQRKLTKGAAAKMQEVGLGSFVGKDLLGNFYVNDFVNASKIIEERLRGLRKTAGSVREKLPLAEQIQQDINKQIQPQATAIPEGGGDGKAGQKLQPYDRSQLQVIQQAFDKGKQILDNKLLEEKISKTAYGIALANLTAVKEKAEAEEGYRLKVLETNRDNMSAADKRLKLFDLEKAKTDELFAVEERRKFAIKKATEEIRSPFKDALRDVNNEIDAQEMQINNLRNGYIGLTAEQEAQLFIQQQTKNLRADEYRAIQDTIGGLQEQVRIRIENNRLLEQERNLAGVRARISGAGGGLMAGFYGSAAESYERSLLESNGNVNYAQQMAQLESQAMQLESVFGSIQNAIGGIGDAFGTMMTQGITQLIQGTASAQEIFSSFLKSVGDALLQAASQMIATYIAIGIAKAFAGLGGGGGQPDKVANFNAAVAAYGLAEGGYLPGGFKAFADGGMVTGPTLGLIGEGGEPEYVIPQSKMRGAMERYAAGTRGASVIPGSVDGAGGGEAMAAMMGPIDVRYQVERINSVDYVTADQFQVGLAQAARQGAAQGEQRTLRRLQMSASTRRRVGI